MTQGKLQRIWPPTEGQEAQVETTTGTTADTTFRQPLPPAIARPRGPVQGVVRGLIGMRMQPIDQRLQGMDGGRMRLVLQQHQQVNNSNLNFKCNLYVNFALFFDFNMAILQQRLLHTAAANPQGIPQQQQTGGAPQMQHQFMGTAVRFPPRPVSVEQFEQAQTTQQQPQQHFVSRAPVEQPRLPAPQGAIVPQQRPTGPTTPAVVSNDPAASTEQEIPDNVTAELEKLEQVSYILHFIYV